MSWRPVCLVRGIKSEWEESKQKHSSTGERKRQDEKAVSAALAAHTRRETLCHIGVKTSHIEATKTKLISGLVPPGGQQNVKHIEFFFTSVLLWLTMDVRRSNHPLVKVSARNEFLFTTLTVTGRHDISTYSWSPTPPHLQLPPWGIHCDNTNVCGWKASGGNIWFDLRCDASNRRAKVRQCVCIHGREKLVTTTQCEAFSGILHGESGCGVREGVWCVHDNVSMWHSAGQTSFFFGPAGFYCSDSERNMLQFASKRSFKFRARHPVCSLAATQDHQCSVTVRRQLHHSL